MSKPSDKLWARDPHTEAKHRLLRGYLDAWLPIIARTRASRIVLIDGFAGPGQHLGGEDGSPIIMLKALLEHKEIDLIARREVVFLFIEQHPERAGHLGDLVDALRPRLPPSVKVQVVPKAYEDAMPMFLPPAGTLAPTFAFLDPFGLDAQFSLSAQILASRRTEVLIYVPIPSMIRFASTADFATSMTNLYGDDRWQAAVALSGEARGQALHDLFLQALRQHATHVRSFEIVTARGGGYHLFFGGNNEMGLLKIKEAMWRVDPGGGQQFRDSTKRDQLVLFEPEPDLLALRGLLRDRFGTGWFTIEDAGQFTLLDTPFLPSHLRTRTLVPAEQDNGLLHVERPAGKRAGSFTPGTRMRFTR